MIVLGDNDMQNNIQQFIAKWHQSDKNEIQGTQSFWIDFLSDVLNIYNPTSYIEFEKSVYNGKTTKRIDGYIPSKKILIEQKDQNIDLNTKITQSDGTSITPFEQAKRYSDYLPLNEKPKWIIVSNFKSFHIHDMDKPYDEPVVITLDELAKKVDYFSFMKSAKEERIIEEQELSVKAGEIVGKIYNELLKQYKNPDNDESLKSINQLCVRLVFCLYAEDAGIFGHKKMFHDYMQQFEAKHWRKAIIELFEVLNTPIEKRDDYLEEDLVQFPYVNGGMFENTNIEIPNFTDELKNIILYDASEGFNWSSISPTIFGAVFESTLNPETRHQGGMHYTSVENIHKVIDPLFLDDLQEELETIQQIKQVNVQKEKAKIYQNKLANLSFLDPACGSGNFLTETYLSLRHLENEALKIIHGNQIQLDLDQKIIKVSLNQFYGIEINDFAVSVAKTALWIAESQMLEETRNIVTFEGSFLPLKTYTNIVEANALTIDWEDVVPKGRLSYIIGNPPFLGARLMNKDQKETIKSVFHNITGYGNLDLVCGWYQKSAEFIKDTAIATAFVSTNSISQGEQANILWKSIHKVSKDIHINYAYKTFKWESDATDKAAVHVVIIGFSCKDTSLKIIENNTYKEVKNINQYLFDAPMVLVEKRSIPLQSNIEQIKFGSMPNDNGYLSNFNEQEKDILIEKGVNPNLFKPIVGAKEFIHRDFTRFALWLTGTERNLWIHDKNIKELIEHVKEFRLASKRAATQKLAEVPWEFGEIRQPETDYLLVPRVSSEKRKYIPIGYMSKDIIATDAVFTVPNASLYTFGILTSSTHNAWMRTVAGRLEMRYRYSNTIVYNNFPWPEVNEKQKEKIEKTAQAVLDARALYPDNSMADLYDELTMPRELRKAHEANDKAVLEAYGLNKNSSEDEIVAHLFTLYNKLVEKEN